MKSSLSFWCILFIAQLPLIITVRPSVNTVIRKGMVRSMSTAARLPQQTSAIARQTPNFPQSPNSSQKSFTTSKVSVEDEAQPKLNRIPINGTNSSIIEQLKKHKWKDGIFEAPLKKGGVLGCGVSGVCYKTKRIGSESFSVLKEINEVDKDGKNNIAQIIREIENQSAINSPFVRKILDWWQDKENGKIKIEMEYMSNDFANLYYSVKKEKGVFTWEQTRYYISQIVEAIIAMNEKGIVHRDIKPGNFLLSDRGIMKLADFGLSLNIETEEATPFISEFHFVAPESKDSGYGKKVDVFSLGVTMFEMLSVKHFTRGETDHEEKADFESIPMEGRELLKSMLERDPEKRCDIQHVKDQLNTNWESFLKKPNSPDHTFKAPITIEDNWYVVGNNEYIEKLTAEDVKREREDELYRFAYHP